MRRAIDRRGMNMAYTLITSERSPFGRVCRMFMIQNRIPFELRILNFVDDVKAAAELAAESPVNKVPILIDNGEKVFDSRVIVNRLIHAHGLTPLTLEMENLVSVIYGALDAGVILFLMRKDGFDLGRGGFFISRNQKRITAALEYVTPWADKLDPAKDWNYASMALHAFLEWAEQRAHLIELKDTPRLQNFYNRFAGAPGVEGSRGIKRST